MINQISKNLVFSVFFMILLAGSLPAAEFTLAPVNPEFITAEEIQTSYGYKPGPLDLSYLRGRPQSFGISAEETPPSFDLRTLSLISPVKNQSPYGACWTFSAMAAIESNLLVRGLGPTDLAERHLAWFGYNSITEDIPGFRSEDLLTAAYDAGGDDWRSIAILSRWTGAVDETSAPYLSGPDPDGTEKNTWNLAHALFLTQMRRNTPYPPITITAAKEALTTYGALSIGVEYNSDCYNAATSAFYNPDSQAGWANHAVNIVGWNDNYPKENFKTAPSADGAWIVRNSWGSAWGDNGYFYISYYDTSLDSGIAYITEESGTKDNIHQYDPLGWCASIISDNREISFANVFEATTLEKIKAVSFYTAELDTSYRIQIYTNVHSGSNNPANGGYLSYDSGWQTSTMTNQPGYHTIDTPGPVLFPNQKFAVIISQKNDSNPIPIAVELPLNGYSERATASAGQSFIKSEDGTWQDITSIENGEKANTCIKAFTDNMPIIFVGSSSSDSCFISTAR